MCSTRFNDLKKMTMKRKSIPLLKLFLVIVAAMPVNLFASEAITAKVPAVNQQMMVLLVKTAAKDASINGSLSYLIGGFIAVLLMVYLVYSLLHPEKF